MMIRITTKEPFFTCHKASLLKQFLPSKVYDLRQSKAANLLLMQKAVCVEPVVAKHPLFDSWTVSIGGRHWHCWAESAARRLARKYKARVL